MLLRELFEFETGERAMYRKGSSDYHTLRYVLWLEKRNQTEGAEDETVPEDTEN